MKLFIDTGELDEIREAAKLGLVDGVTTNPSLIAKSGRSYKDVVREVCEIVNGPINAEVVGTRFDEMMAEAREWHAVHPNVVVKLPMTFEGLRGVRACVKEGIRTNVTLCFSPTQALLAAKAGAGYISPFIGRLDDVSEEGMQLIEQVVRIFENYEFKSQVLVASVRHPMHVVHAALVGADICTVPFKVLTQLIHHPLTDAGLQKFTADAAKIPTAR
jgi:transaldolase